MFKFFNCLLANSSISQVSADKVTIEDDEGQGACTEENGRSSICQVSADKVTIEDDKGQDACTEENRRFAFTQS
jgi:hypothetical protein